MKRTGLVLVGALSLAARSASAHPSTVPHLHADDPGLTIGLVIAGAVILVVAGIWYSRRATLGRDTRRRNDPRAR